MQGNEHAQAIQQELWTEYGALEKTRKLYDEAYGTMAAAKSKLEDNRVKPKGGLMNLMSSREERLERNRKKLNEANRRLIAARNTYLLQLATTNALHRHYYHQVVPDWTKAVDGDFYERIKSMASLVATHDSKLSQILASNATQLQSVAQTMNRDEESAHFLQDFQHLFTPTTSELKLELASGDETRSIFLDDVAKVTLKQRLMNLLQSQVDISAEIGKKQRDLNALEGLKDAYGKTPTFGDADNMGDAVFVLTQELNFHLWKRCKLDAQIDYLHLFGIEAPMPTANVNFQSSQSSLQKNDSKSFLDLDVTVDSSKSSGSSKAMENGTREWNAVALFNYQAADKSELSLIENDAVKILEDPKKNVDGWVKCRVGSSIGVVPLNYLRVGLEVAAHTKVAVSTVTTATSSHHPSKTQPIRSNESTKAKSFTHEVKAAYDYNGSSADGELTFQAGDVILVTNTALEGNQNLDLADQWWEGEVVGSKSGKGAPNLRGQFPVVFVVVPINFRVGDEELVGATKALTFHQTPLYCQALFDYEAQVEGEMNITAGDRIQITDKAIEGDSNKEWYEGKNENNSQSGQFPRSYVKLI